MSNSPENTIRDQAEMRLRLPSRVLYIQHAQGLGGSAVSLRYLVDSMQSAGINCRVALLRPSQELIDYYKSAKIHTIPVEGINIWHHSTVARRFLWKPQHVRELFHVARTWQSSRKATLKLVDRLKPDLVHLNSMPLSAPASALTENSVPFVWHVREPPPDQGLRTRIIRSLMIKAPSLVFITDHDRQLWVGNAKGAVLPNAVPDAWFEGHGERPKAPGDAVRFAYLGGLGTDAKGPKILVKALRLLAESVPGWECVMPGSLKGGSDLPEQNCLDSSQLIDRRNWLELEFLNLAPAVRLMPPAHDILSIMRTVDFVVFPAVRAHFPRPVIEAAALGLPAVGTDVGGVRESILHRVTGILCAPRNPKSLAAALAEMIRDTDFRKAAGERAYSRAKAINTLSAQQKALAHIYQQVLKKGD